MVMADVEDSRLTPSPSQLAWSEGLQLLGTVLHPSDELVEVLHKYFPEY